MQIKEFLEQVGENYQHIVFAERHGDNNEMFQNPDFYEGLKAAGIQTLALEYPSELQPALEAYYNQNAEFFGKSLGSDLSYRDLVGELAPFQPPGGSSNDLTNIAKTMALQIEGARMAGLNIIAMDDTSHSAENMSAAFEAMKNEIKNILDDNGITEEGLRTDLGLPPEIDVYDYLTVTDDVRAQYTEIDQEYHLEEVRGQFAQGQRMLKDQEWAERLPPDQRVAAIIGSSHAANIIPQDGLDEYLGGDEQVATIELARNQDRFDQTWERFQSYGLGGTQPATDQPHATILIEDQKIVPGDKLSPALSVEEKAEKAPDTHSVEEKGPTIPAPT